MSVPDEEPLVPYQEPDDSVPEKRRTDGWWLVALAILLVVVCGGVIMAVNGWVGRELEKSADNGAVFVGVIHR
ncbi:hypothetical protein KOI35_14790 [Actinoplanes bogorensis]|uniref:Uncharacterized protein n=1 Tax=Paractinoplanes bogorensis TaxID=1610840 RepID=A0ABS5YMT0_9ACTN|nr:hypothetical protein [Actinoplanes bogorensis]MBU2664766.1 hypothetical protein [Actinoplanes bogorensis]